MVRELYSSKAISETAASCYYGIDVASFLTEAVCRCGQIGFRLLGQLAGLLIQLQQRTLATGRSAVTGFSSRS